MITRSRIVASGAGASLLLWTVANLWAEPPPVPKAEAPTVQTVSGPLTHANLTIFLLHGKDVMPGKTIITLQDALAQKKAIVHETSQVNELSVENTSDDALVFVQSGDIVKGGKQDRAIAYDMLLPPKSGKIALGSFCCESGRWTKRGGEALAQFNASTAQVAGKELKAAINDARQQGQVWEEVKLTQQKLAKNVGKSVQDPASPTSLQLALEDKQLQEKLGAYEKAIAGAVEGKSDVIGMALCVNGKVEGAEIYGSNALFQQLWPKLLKSAATDALAEFDEKKKFEAPDAKAVAAFLADAAAGPAKEVTMSANGGPWQRGRGDSQTANIVGRGQQQTDAPAQQRIVAQPPQNEQPTAQVKAPTHVRIVRYDGSKVLCIECQDAEKTVVVHRCYFAKAEPKQPPKP